MQRPGPNNEFDHPSTNGIQIMFQCGHCYHYKCYLNFLKSHAGAGLANTLKKIVALKNMPGSEEDVKRLLQDVKLKIQRECWLCSEEAA